MVTKLIIEGFKGFQQIEIPRLSRISLLGGRNNAGKTSVIEALFMFFDRFNPQLFLRQFAWRGIDSILFDPESMWAPAFLDYDLTKKISIIAAINGSEEKMTITFNPNYSTPSIPTVTDNSGIMPQIRTDQRVEPSFSLDIKYDSNEMKNQIAHLTMGASGAGIYIENAKTYSRRATFLAARVPSNYSDDAQKFGQLDILGKQDKIVEFLKIIEPNLKSLSTIAIGNKSLIHCDIGLSKKIPVPYMGDGVSRLLSIILAIATSNNGIVFIDEFENGIHYSVMPKIWEAVAKAAREFNCQVIGTTHSYECLEAAYSGITEDLKDDFSYIRIDKVDNKTTAKCFSHELLKVALKTNMEVR